MTLLGAPKMFTPSEKIVMTFFGLAFVIGTRPWSASNRDSAGYNGVGAFQLIRRGAYEQIGTHRRLAMEVIDDMKLGKLVKESGLHSSVAKGGDAVSVHWHAELRNTIRGTTKNFFAAAGYKLWLVSAQILGLLLMCVFPVAALPFVHGWARLFAAIAVGVPLIMRRRRGDRIQRVAHLRPHLPDRRSDFRVDARALHNRHAVAGRNRVARHLLPAERVKARRGLVFRLRQPHESQSTISVPQRAAITDCTLTGGAISRVKISASKSY